MTFLKGFKSLLLGFILCLLLITTSSAKRSKSSKSTSKGRLLPLTSVHIVDRNGFSETISNKERINQFQNVNFLSPQPYQKVLRIYARDSVGNLRSVVTTYHENGNPKQFLEILNARANGNYYEWHANGGMSVRARVIGGTADVTSLAEKTWLFDGPSYAWDDKGHLIAEINYSQGSLQGMTTYFHPNGQVWKTLPYSKNQLDGTVEIYRNNGELFQQTFFCQGQKQGTSTRYWDCEHLASQEEYYNGKLESGLYFDREGSLIAEVKEGTGFRAIFGQEHILELQEYFDGTLEGEVKVFNQEGRLKRIYHVKNNIKHGEEVEYYERYFDSKAPLQPKLSFYWYEGKIQGMAKSWYPNGVMESRKEMANNTKNGVLTTWYSDASLMLIEEYTNDKLIRGDYFKKEDRIPTSQVIEGNGIATIFDSEGHFVQKITYSNGKPEL